MIIKKRMVPFFEGDSVESSLHQINKFIKEKGLAPNDVVNISLNTYGDKGSVTLFYWG